MRKRFYMPPLLIVVGTISIVAGFRYAPKRGFLVDKLLAAWGEVITATMGIPLVVIGFIMTVTGVVTGLAVLLAKQFAEEKKDVTIDLFQE